MANDRNNGYQPRVGAFRVDNLRKMGMLQTAEYLDDLEAKNANLRAQLAEAEGRAVRKGWEPDSLGKGTSSAAGRVFPINENEWGWWTQNAGSRGRNCANWQDACEAADNAEEAAAEAAQGEGTSCPSGE